MKIFLSVRYVNPHVWYKNYKKNVTGTCWKLRCPIQPLSHIAPVSPTANPVSQIENRMDPTEVGRLNKSNLPQSDESIGGSAVVMEKRREELLVSLDTSSGKRKEWDERNEISNIAEDSTEDKDDFCSERLCIVLAVYSTVS